MKHVVKSNEVAHLWAHKAQSNARASHFYFEGDTIYSYGGHFPIARHVTHKGKAAVLFTTRKYSMTTSGHCSQVRSAIPAGMLVIDCVNPVTDKPGEIMRQYKATAKETEASARRGRVGAWSEWSNLRVIISSANKAAEFFGLATRLREPVDMYAKIKEANAASRVRDEKREARREKQRQLDALEFAERLPLWLAGDRQVRLPYNHGESYLRLVHHERESDSEVETSRGARVPLDHVKAALPLVLRLLAEGKTYAANGHTIHIGYYQLDAIESDGTVVAGCHRFARAEVERFAATL